MPRYTKKDSEGRYYIESANGKLESNIKGHTYGEAIDRFAEFENADVVPKSEVERLVDKWIGEEGITQDAMVLRLIEALRDEAKRYEKYYFNHEYDKLIAEAKQDVAREIFEEIGKLIIYRMIADTTLIDDRLITDIAELKKKYTKESEGKE